MGLSYVGTFHKMSSKHLDRYLAEFCGRWNARSKPVLERMHDLVLGMERKQLRYRDLIRDNGLPSGARLTASNKVLADMF